MSPQEKFSINPLNNKKYKLPSVNDDVIGIDSFLEKNKGKKVVVVQGLGFVGSVMSIVCANALKGDYAVIGIDLASEDSYWKIASINEGIFPVISSDQKVAKYYEEAKEKGNLYATFDPYAFSKADVIIVDINLDVSKNDHHINQNSPLTFDVNLENFESAIKSIGKNCQESALILIETTVPPGSTKIAQNIIQDCLQERDLDTSKIRIGHSYERVMPGPNYIDSIQNFYRVYSGVDDESADSVERFLRTIISTDEYPLTRLKSTNSTEMSKVLENSYRAMNIAFIVEWSRYAEESGVDLYEVVNAIRMRPTHKNIMYPGIGVGGYCLTKDPLLASWSRQKIMDGNEALHFSEKAVLTNDRMPLDAYKFLRKHFIEPIKDKNIFMLGVSYGPDIGDTRYSPVQLLCELLIKDSANLFFHDPYVKYWTELHSDVEQDFNKLDRKTDIVIISTGHSFYIDNIDLINTLNELEDLFILDTIGILSDLEIKKLSKKHKVKILGRGDI